MRILGIDLGEKRIGISISDELGITAQGLPTINSINEIEDLKNIKKIIDKYSVCLLYTSPSPRDRQKSRMPSSA